jgi:hypothetical protein
VAKTKTLFISEIQLILYFISKIGPTISIFAFSLLRLIASTCFEHLLAHHQEVLYVQQLVYFVCWNWSNYLKLLMYIVIEIITFFLNIKYFLSVKFQNYIKRFWIKYFKKCTVNKTLSFILQFFTGPWTINLFQSNSLLPFLYKWQGFTIMYHIKIPKTLTKFDTE